MGADGLDPPLRVDWLDRTRLRGERPGRLGLTYLPGKHGASVRYPGLVYRRDLERDVAELRAQGIGLLVLLVDDGELARWGDAAIVARAATFGLAVRRWPMADGTAPATAEAMDEILEEIDRGRASTDVAVACMGGVGRTGTVAACALVAAGMNAAESIAHVRAVRHPTAVETPEQEAFVVAYARHRARPDSVRGALKAPG